MPRYYFDVTEAGQDIIDDEGDTLRSDHEARAYLRRLLAEQAANLLRSRDAGEIIVNVRDGTGPRFRAKLSMSVE
jgi:hypothetical protein